MAYYRIYIVNSRHTVLGSCDLICSTDREAFVVAESMLEPGLEAEIWSGQRRLRLTSFRRTISRPTATN